MLQFSESYLRDRITACWIGKNIGGTLGTPYEGTRELLDIRGFASKPGEPLPNDDLDLQLAWLRCVNDLGPRNVNSKTLGEYWLSWVTPHWNEYGEGKANMRDGLLPPMSGEYNNAGWKHSNGAWIRTEIWACLYPALPGKATRYAFEDASVDHGYGEGSYAAIFVAAMESAAFVVNDARKLLEIGLGNIPEDCRVARAVRLVMDCYDRGIDWKECRARVVEDSADLGWFQAPANVAFTVLGLLYGAGDFKRSLLLAIDCGDDTDCTGATLGSLLGIMGGMAAIPEDWRAFIGEEIKSICLVNGHGPFPQTIGQLTDSIFNLLPVTLRQEHQKLFSHADADLVRLGAENDFSQLDEGRFFDRSLSASLAQRKPNSFVIEGLLADVLVEFDDKPVITPEGTLSGCLTVTPNACLPGPRHYHLTWLLPSGWSVESPLNLYTHAADHGYLEDQNKAAFTLFASENVGAVNDLAVELTVPGRALPILVPIRVLG